MKSPRYDEYRGLFLGGLIHGLSRGMIRWGGGSNPRLKPWVDTTMGRIYYGLSRGIQAPTNALYASASIKPSSSDGLESSIFMSQPLP
jgi:hypothetical protein